MPGYNKPLYILPFDHRSFFARTLFNKTAGLSDEEREVIKDFKKIIYQGVLLGIESGVPESEAAILVDEQYGAEIHADATRRGLINILTTEKSGGGLFEFEYGDDFPEHLEAIPSVFAKALLHYRADGDASQNQIQLERLKRLSDWCQSNSRGFLVEPLISPSPEEKKAIGQEAFDRDVRPGLTVDMIRQFQEAGIETDIWKIEGMENAADYRLVVAQARAGGRDDVSIVVLGRSESDEHVERWLNAGKGIEGVVGFAIGRTIFWEALRQYNLKIIDRDRAIDAIAANYLHFYEVFVS